jgi:hypothetical protein
MVGLGSPVKRDADPISLQSREGGAGFTAAMRFSA